jgi:hypothetical protein
MVITPAPSAFPKFSPPIIPALPVFAVAVAVIDRFRIGCDWSIARGFVLIRHLAKYLMLIIANVWRSEFILIQFQKLNARGV